MEFATRQSRLEHIAGVHRAFGFPGAHHGVQFINEDDGLTLVLGQVFQDVFQALFEFAPELGPRQQRGHVQRQHPFTLQRIGHLACHNPLGQAFNDGSLTDTGLANQHRVVLGAALQHLNSTADFIVPSYDRVELARAGALCQVHAVLLQRFALVFGVGAVHALPATHCQYGRVQAFAAQTQSLGLFCKVRLGLA